MADIYNGDCMDLMRSIPDGSVDLVLTDPPYNIGVSTQTNGNMRGGCNITCMAGAGAVM